MEKHTNPPNSLKRERSQSGELLDKEIKEKINELKIKLETLIKKDMHYIENQHDIKNTERYLIDINSHLEIETIINTDSPAYKYYKSENLKTNELLETLKRLSNNDDWKNIRSVLAQIKSVDTDNIYTTVHNMLIDDNQSEKKTEQSTIKGHYIFFLMIKDDPNKKDEITSVLNLINEYKTRKPASFNSILKQINDSRKKIPSSETLNKHNIALSLISFDRQRSPNIRLNKDKVEKKMRFSTPCKKDADCNEKLNQKCIQEVCSGMEGIELSDKYTAMVSHMVSHGKPLPIYPTKRTQQRDGSNKLIRKRK
jgi:hypothetical protein